MNTLFAEQDERLAIPVVQLLRSLGHDVDWARDEGHFQWSMARRIPDFALVDLDFAHNGGLNVLRRVHEETPLLQIIAIVPRLNSGQRFDAIDAGASDFIVKPFSLVELIHRLMSVTHRKKHSCALELTGGLVSLNVQSRVASVADQHFSLSTAECSVLQELLLRAGHVLSGIELAERSRAGREALSVAAVEDIVDRLTKQLGANAIRRFRGLGWSVEPVRAHASARPLLAHHNGS